MATREAIEAATAGRKRAAEEASEAWRARVAVGTWCLWQQDSLNWTVQPNTTRDDAGQRSYYPDFKTAALALHQKVIGERVNARKAGEDLCEVLRQGTAAVVAAIERSGR